jgi:hypothetical protein
MAYAEQQHVDRLEEALQEFVRSVGIEFKRVHNAQLRLTQEVTELKVEMKDFKDEMKEFKDEMKEFKDETRKNNREMNRRWGELSNKMGTLVEDLVAPSLPRIIRERTGLDVTDLGPRRLRRLPDGRDYEFDAIAVTDRVVFLNSTKSNLKSEYVAGFAGEIARFREGFPEYHDRPVVGILASLSVRDDVLRQAERAGYMVLAAGDGIMECINTPGFEPRHWRAAPPREGP